MALFAGAHESALGDIVLAPGESPETARTLLDALPPSGADVLDVFGLPGESALARAAGPRLRAIQRVESPVTEMPDGWDDAYKRHTSGNRRNQDRRRERQLGELGALEFSLATDAEACAPICPTPLRCTACAGRDGRTDRRSACRPVSASSAWRCPSSPTRAASRCSRCVSTAARSRSTRGSSSGARSTCIATRSTLSCRATARACRAAPQPRRGLGGGRDARRISRRRRAVQARSRRPLRTALPGLRSRARASSAAPTSRAPSSRSRCACG